MERETGRAREIPKHTHESKIPSAILVHLVHMSMSTGSELQKRLNCSMVDTTCHCWGKRYVLLEQWTTSARLQKLARLTYSNKAATCGLRLWSQTQKRSFCHRSIVSHKQCLSNILSLRSDWTSAALHAKRWEIILLLDLPYNGYDIVGPNPEWLK